MENLFLEKVKKYRANLSSKDIDFNKMVKSSFLNNYLENLANSLIPIMAVPMKVYLLHDDDEGQVPTSLTDGEKIYLNSNHKLVQNFVAYENKVLGILGFLFHESAHIRYLDFKGENEAINVITEGKMPFSKPICHTEKEHKELSKLLAAIKDKQFEKIFLELYFNIASVISDYHDEEKLCKEHGPLVKKSILTIREGLFASVVALENMEQNDEFSPLSIMMSLLLQYSRFNKVLTLREETLQKSPYIDALKKSAVHIDDAKMTDDIEVKFNNINAVVLNLWHFINEAIKEEKRTHEAYAGAEKSEEGAEDGGREVPEEGGRGEDGCEECDGGEGEGEGGPSQGTDEVLSQIQKAVSSCGGAAFSNPPKNILDKVMQQGISEESGLKENDLQEFGSQSSDKIVQNVVDDMVSDLLDGMAEELAREEQNNDVMAKIKTGNMCSIHSGICVNMKIAAAGQEDKSFYEKIIDKNKFFIKKLKREIEKIIQEEDTTILKHRYFGRKIDAKSAFKVDQRYFTKKKNPEKLLDMAITILVDNSGSMEGIRICSAKEATILITEVLELIEIPALIAGHTFKNGMCFSIFKNFEDIKNAKFSINKMMAGGDNRDGLALDIAGNLLADRGEKNKLLIIISDGQPNSSGYAGDLAKNDIKDIVKKYKQMGIKTLAFAIGDDKQQIKEIYGDAYIDISDLEKFPKTLSKIIEKEIISNL